LCVAGAGQCQGRADARAGVVSALRRRIRLFSGFGNRALLACGRAFAIGDTSELDELLKQVIAGKTAALTAAEKRTLRAYHAGEPPWRRGRGQWRTHGGIDKRKEHALEMERLVRWTKQIRCELQNDPAEQKLKRELRAKGERYWIETRTIERTIELMQRDEDAVIPSFDSLRNALRGRSRKKTTT
jgi:hypothetical protein